MPSTDGTDRRQPTVLITINRYIIVCLRHAKNIALFQDDLEIVYIGITSRENHKWVWCDLFINYYQ